MPKIIIALFALSWATASFAADPENVPASSQSYSVNTGPTTPKEYVVPRVSSTDAPLRKRASKSCREYLAICERSCGERGGMFKFQCIGKDFQPFKDHFRCFCSDDLGEIQ